MTTTCIWNPVQICTRPCSNTLFTGMECMKWSLPALCNSLCCRPKMSLKKELTAYLKKSPDRAYFEDGDFFTIQISQKIAGAFIGLNGKNIAELRKKYSSKILVSNENGKRFIYISKSCDKNKCIQQLNMIM